MSTLPATPHIHPACIPLEGTKPPNEALPPAPPNPPAPTLTIRQYPVTTTPVGGKITYTALYGTADVTSTTEFTTSAPAVVKVDEPTLTSLVPSQLRVGTSGTFVFTGTHIRSTQTIGGLPQGVTASGYAFTGTTITVTLTATATASTEIAKVFISDSTHGNSNTQQLTIPFVAPTLTSISPASINQGTSGTYTLTGTSIRSTQTIGGLPAGVTASSLTFTPTTITATLTAATNAVLGATNVYIVDSVNGNSGTQVLTVNPPAPTLTSVSPSSIEQSTNGTYTFTGTNILSTHTIGGLPAGVTASGYTFTLTTIVVTLTASDTATLGTANVYIVDTTSGNSNTKAFTVTAALLRIAQAPTSPSAGGAITYTTTYRNADVTASTEFTTSNTAVVTVDPPTFTALSPASIAQGTSGTYTLTGTHIRSTQTIGGLPTGVTASSLTFTGTTITATLTATGTATLGAANIFITDTTHGNSGTQPLSVTTPPQPPTFTALSPASITQGTSGTYTFTGTNIRPTQTIGGLPTGVTASSLTFTGTTITATLTATGTATLGAANVFIADATYGNSGTQVLTVNAPSGIPSLPVTSGLVLRLHAGAGVTQSANAVSAWADQSTTATTFSQATGTAQPTLVANAYNNTKPTLRFSGAQSLAAAAAVTAFNSTDYTVFMVARPSTLANGTYYPWSNSSAAAFSGEKLGYYTGGGNLPVYRGITGNGTAFMPTQSTTEPLTTRLDAIALLQTSTIPERQRLYVNNVKVGTSGEVLVNNTTAAPMVGTDGTNPFSGDVCEIIRFNRSLTDAELASMATYFQTEWGTL